jgi:alkyl hydroperoxide reductase subunit AhpC
MTSHSYMQKIIFAALCLGALLGITVSAQNTAPAAATIGQSAPNFTLQGSDGKTHSLADFKGKFVVLEWTNPNCPFVHKFYDSGTMQKLQKEETAKGVDWLRINSAAEGHDGYQTASDLASYAKDNNVAATESLLDPDGKVGHTYGARTTPHMFVIDPKGVLIYAGGIDDTPSPDPATLATAKNYVTTALDEAMGGKPVTTPTARPYGCSVKYASN